MWSEFRSLSNQIALFEVVSNDHVESPEKQLWVHNQGVAL